MTGAAAASQDQLESEYGTVVDMVDAGADPNGNESVTSVIQDNIGDDTLLKFPDGEYYMDDQVRLTGFNKVGVIGDGATLVPADFHSFGSSRARLFRLGTSDSPGGTVHFGGFHVDQTASNTGIRVISAEVTDELYVKDVFIDGVHDSGTWGPGKFNIVDSNGVGVVDNFRASDGAEHVDDTPNDGRWRGATGIILNENHQGEITFTNCVLGGFPDNGLYASSQNGEIHVENGWFENSGTASVRLSSERGSIHNVFAVVDENPDQLAGQHGIRLDHGSQIDISNVTIETPSQNGEALRIMEGVDSTSITNTRIAAEGQSAAVRIDENAGEVDVENSEVEINDGSYAFRILGDDAGAVTLQDVSITGEGGGSPIQEAIFVERNNCEFRGLSVQQTGGDGRRGIEFRGQGYVIADSDFETTNYPITIHNASDVRVENTHARATDGSGSILIRPNSNDVSLSNNDFPDGVDDRR
jgi:hypothetical protein